MIISLSRNAVSGALRQVAALCTPVTTSRTSQLSLRFHHCNAKMTIPLSKDFFLRQLFDSQSSTYTYILADTDKKEAVIIDPVLEQAKRDAQLIKELGFTLKYALNTHMHADHVTGTGYLKQLLPGTKSVISKASGALADEYLEHCDEVEFGRHKVKAVSTPGHTNGCMTFIVEEQGIAFTGDTLLIRGCGRTDFQEGDSRLLYKNVHEQIFTLPDNFRLFPAHDYKGQLETTVAEEKQFNPRLSKDIDTFVNIMENKFEVQVRHCFCCGLSIGSVFIALYTLLLFSLLTGLAIYGLSDTNRNGDKSHYTSCELEAQGKINAENRKLTIHNGHQTVIIEDSTSYHCSIGLYTEELKFSAANRSWILFWDIFTYILIIIASLIMLIGLMVYSQWLLLPWIAIMCFEVFRGLLSVFFMFWYSYWNLARLAAAIFFLGLQLFHISLIVLVIAKFQRMYNRNTGVVVDADKQYDPQRPYTTATLPSNYGAYSPQVRRNGNVEPYAGGAYSDYSPSQKDPRSYDSGYRPPPQGIRY